MLRLSPTLALVAALVVALVGACSASGGDPRTGFLVTTLTADNQRWLDRDPAAVAGKYRKMALREFDYVRGTAGQYWRDVLEAGPVARGSSFASGDAAWLWIVGDPHLENLGTFRGDDGVVALDWNDFDAATIGPWWLDLRRLAVGLALAADELELGPDADRALVEAAVRAYADEVPRLATGGEPRSERGDDDPVLADLVASARRSGDRLARLADYTRIDDRGARVMFFGDVIAPREPGLWIDSVALVSIDERATIEAAISSWRRDTLGPPAGAVKGVSRRLGAGVASYPAPRYYALLDGPTAAVDDDLLLELKEAIAPPSIAAHGPPGWYEAATDGARAVAAQRLLGAQVDADPLLGAGEVPPLSYRVRARTGYQRGLELAELAGDRPAALAAAALAGRALARAHARAPVPDQPTQRAGDRIAPQLVGRADLLVTETATFARDYAAVVRADAARFADALAELGPVLGAQSCGQ